MTSNGLCDIPDSYLLVSCKIANKQVRALVDSGAQPTVVKRSLVPLGTPIVYQNWCLKGVKGPRINIVGTADIPFEVGYKCFTQNCVVVEDSVIDFPASADVIIGANMLILHQLDVSPSTWALLHDGEFLQHFEPSRVDGHIFSSAELDYIRNANVNNCLEPEVGCEADELVEPSYASLVDTSVVTNDIEYDNANCLYSDERRARRVSQQGINENRFYPAESALNENVPDTQYYTETVAQPPKRPRRQILAGEPDQPPERHYNIATIANCNIPSQQMGLVDVTITDGNGDLPPAEDIFELDAGVIFPGAILLPGIAANTAKIAVINYNSDSLLLSRGIPFATATKF